MAIFRLQPSHLVGVWRFSHSHKAKGLCQLRKMIRIILRARNLRLLLCQRTLEQFIRTLRNQNPAPSLQERVLSALMGLVGRVARSLRHLPRFDQ